MTARLRNFLGDTRAAVALETVIITPLLIWAFVASFIFFDAYRVYNTSVKTTYMVADMISRQTDTVYGHDISGMANVAQSIVRGAGNIEMRVSQVARINDAFTVEWSHGVNGAARIFDSNIPAIQDRLPNMPNGERIILVETFVDYEMPFNVGLTVTDFNNFTFVRPRYAGQVPFSATGTPPAS
ncbi:hypothetical protein P6F26_03065 [Roseibacterium sp. SDUM158017]|uniref:TadE/TadG family type IV pilus assembly protein n=1 Tax=Roseicyclus salinarum TaxID=3036773 RepID=UPI00241576D8|nr:hypothetical protein [Roseibacterium sp. SDUM158017]MDG4647413.1 hypothetical protein [Roseibacterium sp. SDUM158017]